MILIWRANPQVFKTQWRGPAGDTRALAQAVQNGVAVAVVGPPGADGTALIAGDGISMLGVTLNLNIAELPLA
jgi:hypothetical protein